jgi:hypothetical protein
MPSMMIHGSQQLLTNLILVVNAQSQQTMPKMTTILLYQLLTIWKIWMKFLLMYNSQFLQIYKLQNQSMVI